MITQLNIKDILNILQQHNISKCDDASTTVEYIRLIIENIQGDIEKLNSVIDMYKKQNFTTLADLYFIVLGYNNTNWDIDGISIVWDIYNMVPGNQASCFRNIAIEAQRNIQYKHLSLEKQCNIYTSIIDLFKKNNFTITDTNSSTIINYMILTYEYCKSDLNELELIINTCKEKGFTTLEDLHFIACGYDECGFDKKKIKNIWELYDLAGGKNASCFRNLALKQK